MEKSKIISPIKLSVILPCQNEEDSLATCIETILKIFQDHSIAGEIIISDSSSDRSPEIARSYDVKLVKHDKDGYGNAYLEGFQAAQGKYIFMADADGTYDFAEIPRFLKTLEEGADFVIGNRFSGQMDKDAMPWLHKYVGNPILSFLLRWFFKANVQDVHCGMRAIRKSSLENLNLQTAGMEFASEMVIKAIKKDLKIKEFPINYHVRSGESKLRSIPDGWRHLRFMLLYSPDYLFLLPGFVLFMFGAICLVWLYFENPSVWGVTLYYHPMFIFSAFVTLGYQIMIFALFAKTYALTHLEEKDPFFESLFQYITIESASILGLIIAGFGGAIILYIFIQWVSTGLSALQEVKNFIMALTLITLGAQTIFSSFMLSILGIKEQ